MFPGCNHLCFWGVLHSSNGASQHFLLNVDLKATGVKQPVLQECLLWAGLVQAFVSVQVLLPLLSILFGFPGMRKLPGEAPASFELSQVWLVQGMGPELGEMPDRWTAEGLDSQVQ